MIIKLDFVFKFDFDYVFRHFVFSSDLRNVFVSVGSDLGHMLIFLSVDLLGLCTIVKRRVGSVLLMCVYI